MTPPSMPSVVLQRLPDGPDSLLLPGDVIGRSGAAAMAIDHPGISEVHAYVSLRGGKMVLFALRGRIGLDDKVLPQFALEPGQTIRLARNIQLIVKAVTLPHRVLALEGDDLTQRVLMSTCSLVCEPEPTVVPGNLSDAPLQFWSHDGEWHVQRPDGSVEDVSGGTSWQVGGRRFTASWIALHQMGSTPTRAAECLNGPLLIRAKYNSVHIERDGGVAVSLSGRQAQLVSELIAFDGPADWAVVAREIWGRSNADSLRRKLDATLHRLRKRLATAGIRRDLVRPDGCGKLELVVGSADRIEAEL